MIQAVTGLLVPVSLAFILFAETPTVITLVGFLPLLLVIASVCVEVVALHEFGREYGVRVGPRQYVGLVLGTMPYQWLLAFAAVRAVVRERRGETGWEKTAHVGAHRSASPASIPADTATDGHARTGAPR